MSNPYVTTVIRCAGPNCDKTRQQTNHWLTAFTDCDTFEIRPWPGPDIRRLEDYELPVCGDACAGKLLQVWLSEMKSKSQAAIPAKE